MKAIKKILEVVKANNEQENGVKGFFYKASADLIKEAEIEIKKLENLEWLHYNKD